MHKPAQEPAEPTATVVVSLALALASYRLVAALVPFLAHDLVDKGLRGRDMLKRGFKRDAPARDPQQRGADAQDPPDDSLPGRKWIPEATGVIGASVYILLLALFAPLPYLSSLLPSALSTNRVSLPILNTTSPLILPTDNDPCAALLLEGSLAFPHHSFATYLASLLSLLIATFLGFCDDVFDIRWRFKLPIPVIASVPLLVTYAAGHGITDVVLPKVFRLRELLGGVATNGVVHLGPLYYLYMSMLSTFCTNSINILAGVNGVEVAQALLIALSIIANDLLYLTFSFAPLLPLVPYLPSSLTALLPPVDTLARKTWTAGFAHGSQELADRHLFSLYFMLPLVGVCLGLLKHNWYPARAFVGDTFCYFSGMAFAVVGILGHFSKTLLLFFLPQIFNFLYSCPQLFGLVPCPRHRLPRLDDRTGLLVPSWAPILPRAQRSPLQHLGVALLVLLEKFGLVALQRAEQTREVEACTNLTLLNLALLRGGSVREDVLTKRIMWIQAAGSAVAFAVRYGAGKVIYGDEGGRL
ncbi:UDP-N-acetylglucosamine--dolichyl-phosphate N-acetylglucosaminephosphotransferase [Rhodotorula paludigena]|uniref:UDP-N-acetylglucosamine--dolichyl-phosphate N-acetylglucosaminephosphotransferase n=1 Tax=Rhodotorula paludigena TaxID=86838 RepID=UPI0031816EE8